MVAQRWVRKVSGSSPTLAAMYGPWASPSYTTTRQYYCICTIEERKCTSELPVRYQSSVVLHCIEGVQHKSSQWMNIMTNSLLAYNNLHSRSHPYELTSKKPTCRVCCLETYTRQISWHLLTGDYDERKYLNKRISWPNDGAKNLYAKRRA